MELISSEFRRLPETTYLNAASTGPLPDRAVKTLEAFNAKRAAPWTITLDEQLGGLARSRALCAQLINASPEEIALTPNTSTGLHIASWSLPVPKGKIILGYDGEFPANVYPWMVLEQTRGIRYERIPLCDGLPDHDALIERIARGDVGLVTISWVSFVSGDRADLKRIGDACKANGVWFVVDAIQGVGAVQLDMRELHIDILSCGAQKWLCSPWGSAFTYIRRELIETLKPVTGGWFSVRHSEDFARTLEYDLTYFNDARKFEVATIPYQDFIGMNSSLDVLLEIGLGPIEQRVNTLTTQLIEGIDAIPGLTLLTPRAPERRAGIVSCYSANVMEIAKRLHDTNIIVSIRGDRVLRFSPHFYNTSEDIARTLNALD